MKTNEFSKYLDGVLINQTKKLIKEQVEENGILEKVKKFQTLSGLVDNISTVKNLDNGFIIVINNLSDNELIDSCGGDSPEDAQKFLLQGLHHDMEEMGLGNNMDLDLSIEGENGTYDLQIKVSINDDNHFGDEDIEEDNQSNDGSVDTGCDCKNKDKNQNKLILGSKKIIENMKNEKVVRLKESQMVKLLSNLITESNLSQPYTNSVGKTQVDNSSKSMVPGVNVTNKSRNDSGKENTEALKNVDKKMKEYLSFDGNDNPEFPKQIGKGEKVARENTEDQEQEISDNRGRGPQDLDYDLDDKQTERNEKALTGDSTMGNNEEEGGNTIKSDVGKDMVKNAKRRVDIKKNEPLYNKESVPTSTEKKKLNEDIEKMKSLIGYNRRTQ